MFRIFTCALALAAMAGQIGSYAHLAFTRHITCAEHGELVEAAAAGGTVDEHRETRVADGGLSGAHGHDHCAIAPQRRDRTHLSSPAPHASTLPELVVARALVVVNPPSPFDLLLLAPKNSPPA
jgi:hypothetical protein